MSENKVLITQEDNHTHATRADVKRAAQAIRHELDKILFGFQQGLVAAEQRYTVSWNASNAILKALLDKGLVTEEDIVLAGKELYTEAKNYEKAKIEEAKLAKEGVVPLHSVTMAPTPLESLTTSKFKETD